MDGILNVSKEDTEHETLNTLFRWCSCADTHWCSLQLQSQTILEENSSATVIRHKDNVSWWWQQKLIEREGEPRISRVPMIGLHQSNVMGMDYKLGPKIDPIFQGQLSMCQPFTSYFFMILMSIMSQQRHTTTLLISGGISCPSLGGKVHLAHQPQLSDVLRIFPPGAGANRHGKHFCCFNGEILSFFSS